MGFITVFALSHSFFHTFSRFLASSANMPLSCCLRLSIPVTLLSSSLISSTSLCLSVVIFALAVCAMHITPTASFEPYKAASRTFISKMYPYSVAVGIVIEYRFSYIVNGVQNEKGAKYSPSLLENYCFVQCVAFGFYYYFCVALIHISHFFQNSLYCDKVAEKQRRK